MQEEYIIQQIVDFIKNHYAPKGDAADMFYASTQEAYQKIQAHLQNPDITPSLIAKALIKLDFTHLDNSQMNFEWIFYKK